jgi:mRNA interferase MazF
MPSQPWIVGAAGERELGAKSQARHLVDEFATLRVLAGSRMTVVAHPAPGTIVRVDLTEGFRAPEIGKRRPAVVLSPPIPGRSLICTIVPLSTSEPRIKLAHHMQLVFDPRLPEPYSKEKMWLKGDIVLTVAFHRLRLLFSKWDGGQRVYDVRVLEPAVMKSVRACVRAGVGL